MTEKIYHCIELFCGAWTPLIFLLLFILASILMVWRLECMGRRGLQGTALGTLVMPYCSGLGNLMFVFILLKQGPKAGPELVINCLVNNATNVTLLLGLPLLIWGAAMLPFGVKKKGGAKVKREQHLSRLELVLTMLAALFFSALAWILTRDGFLSRVDGLVLIALFLFWQCFSVFDVLKYNVHKGQSLSPWLLFDALLLAVGAYGLYLSIDWLTNWAASIENPLIGAQQMGWLSGWLMVLPNAFLAFYYAHKRQGDVVYSSQIGDGHICIPLALGLFAVWQPCAVPAFFGIGLVFIGAAIIPHILQVLGLRYFPRVLGAALVIAYGVFLWKGLAA